MTLKTLCAFHIKSDAIPAQDKINRVGAQQAARECQFQETKNWGYKQFERKVGTAEEYVTPLHSGRWLHLRLSLYKRLLPSAVVNQKTEQRAQELAVHRNEPLTAKEKRELKEEIRLQLLEKAFQKETVYQILIDKQTSQLWMDAPSSSLQDEILRFLRRSFGSMPVTPLLETNNLPTHFASWIAGSAELPKGLRIGDSAKAIDPDDPKATITLSHEALLEPDIQNVLETRIIKQVGLESEHVQAIINDDGLLKSIKMAVNTEDDEADPEHMLTLWCLEMAQFIEAVAREVGQTAPPTDHDNSEEHEAPSEGSPEEDAGDGEDLSFSEDQSDQG